MVIQAFACSDVIMPEGEKARTGCLAGNPEMSRTMMPPTFFDGLNPRKIYHEGVKLKNRATLIKLGFFRVLCGATVGSYVVQIWSRNTPDSGVDETLVLHRVEVLEGWQLGFRYWGLGIGD